ncbi:MAG: hypothetical protein JXR88_10865 [Clostridia bacterium]|nr:hypothetical protein [Clostridia bacterium]
MRIDSYNVEQKALSQYQRVEKQQIQIDIQQMNIQDDLELSKEGLSVQEVEDPEEFLSDEDKRKIELLESFITWLTGKEFKFDRMYAKNGKSKQVHKQPQEQGFAMRIHTSHEVYESEKMSFKSSGVVKTADGREINFDLNLNMSRETYEKNEMMLQTGNFHDPLVMNFDGAGVDFADKKIQIDINLDGQLDEINFLNSNSGFLALDKNNNGIIDDGHELFGPETNSGFGELAVYDEDRNGWIDENDSIFESLKIWTLGEGGETELIGLKDADVGAIYLGAVASNYTIKHGDDDMAKIAGSSIYLKESGEAQVIHEIDLKL